MRLGIAITSVASSVPTHSTLHIVWSALSAGHAVWIFEPWDFEVDVRGRLRGRAHVFEQPVADREALSQQLANRTTVRRSVDVERLDVLLLRINPLHDAVLTFARLAAQAGVIVLNDPSAVLWTSHKSWLATLSDVPRPRTTVSRSPSVIACFAADCARGVVIKPARSSGGKSISIVDRRHTRLLEAAIDEAGRAGDGYIVAQEYLPEAALGERRLLWLDGQLLGGYLRQRAPGDFRHNLKVGGVPEAYTPTAHDHALFAALTPHLQRAGIWFAGVDVIGDRVVEVNTLNPGGLHYASLFSGHTLAQAVVTSLERRLQPPAPTEHHAPT